MVFRNLKIIILLSFTLNAILSCNRSNVIGNNADLTSNSSTDLNSIIPPKSGSKFLYIANGGFPIYCKISQINGNILNCNNTVLNIDKSIGISVYKKYPFVLNRGENQVYKCYISSNVMLTYCSVNIISNLIQDSKHLTINNGYFYAISLSNNDIYGSQISLNRTLNPVTLKFTHLIIQNSVSMTQDKNNFYLLTKNANKVIQFFFDNTGINLS